VIAGFELLSNPSEPIFIVENTRRSVIARVGDAHQLGHGVAWRDEPGLDIESMDPYLRSVAISAEPRAIGLRE